MNGQQNVSAIVDLDRVRHALESPATYSAQAPMKMDYGSQFLVPFALYLCYFLDSFTAGNGQNDTRT